MNISKDDYNKIDSCPVCGRKIKPIKMDYIKKRIPDISEEELQSLKICSSCKRKQQ